MVAVAVASGAQSSCSSALTAVCSVSRSEEHTSELQSPCNLVCRLLLEKKKQLQLASSQLASHDRESLATIQIHHKPLAPFFYMHQKCHKGPPLPLTRQPANRFQSHLR